VLLLPPASADSKVYRRTLQSTVIVAAEESLGTGVLLDLPNRLIATCHHVVGDRNEVAVFFPMTSNGRIVTEFNAYIADQANCAITGRVVVRDASRDLAIVQLDRIPEGCREIPLATADPEPGDEVHTIGNSGVGDSALWRYSMGSVRQRGYRRCYVSGSWIECQILETQIPINSGDSGGPILNSSGELVALNMASHGSQTLVSLGVDVREVQALLVRFYLELSKATPAITQLFLPPQASTESTDAADLLFSNQLDRAVMLSWIGCDGTVTPPEKIEPGQSFRYSTFVGHAWLIHEVDGTPVGCFTIENSGVTLTLTAALIGQLKQNDVPVQAERQLAWNILQYLWKTPISADLNQGQGGYWVTQFREDGSFTELTVGADDIVAHQTSGTYKLDGNQVVMHANGRLHWAGQIHLRSETEIQFVYPDGTRCCGTPFAR